MEDCENNLENERECLLPHHSGETLDVLDTHDGKGRSPLCLQWWSSPFDFVMPATILKPPFPPLVRASSLGQALALCRCCYSNDVDLFCRINLVRSEKRLPLLLEKEAEIAEEILRANQREEQEKKTKIHPSIGLVNADVYAKKPTSYGEQKADEEEKLPEKEDSEEGGQPKN